MKDLKEKVEEEEREVFELKVLDIEEASFHILGCAKTMRSAFLLYKAKVLAEEDAKNVLKDLEEAVKCPQETFTYLKEWMENILKADEREGEHYERGEHSR